MIDEYLKLITMHCTILFYKNYKKLLKNVFCAVHYGKKDGLNWVTLRLADVIGPRDTTYR